MRFIPLVISAAFGLGCAVAGASSAPDAVSPVYLQALRDAQAAPPVDTQSLGPEIEAASRRAQSDMLEKVQASLEREVSSQLDGVLRAQTDTLDVLPARVAASAAAALQVLNVRAAGAVQCAMGRSGAVCVSVAAAVI